jgi:hypothetical protein
MEELEMLWIRRCSHSVPGTEPHVCPYRAEIGDDVETLCLCCEACEQECADDI